MIICFEGTPGSGKSYDAVRKIVDNLKAGRRVYTNIDGLDLDEQREHIKIYAELDDYEFKNRLHHLDIAQTREFWKHVKQGSLVVIDETQNFFNSRDWNKDSNREVTAWASTHRHHGFDVVLITQDITRIDSALRSLVEWTYRYKKMNFFGSLSKNQYLVYPYSGDGSGKPLSKPMVRSYEKRVFDCYKSYVQNDIKELQIMKHVNLLRHPVFYALGAAVLLFIYLFTKSGFSHGEIIPGSDAAKKLLAKKAVALASVGSTIVDLSPRAKPLPMRGDGVYSAGTASAGPDEFLCRGYFAADDVMYYIFVKVLDLEKESPKNYTLKMANQRTIDVEVNQRVILSPEIIARLQ